MTYFNRTHPLQPFSVIDPGLGGNFPNIPPVSGQGAATATVTFTATATATTTRTGSATATVSFSASATSGGFSVDMPITIPGQPNGIANAMVGNQSIIGLGMSAGSW